MRVSAKSAVIDTDFVIKLSEINRPLTDVHIIVKAVFTALALEVLMHPLVYEHEVLSGNKKVKSFFENAIIGNPSLKDILQDDPVREAYYEYVMPELYKALNGYEIALSGKTTVYTYWKSGESLGEIHSLTMCLLCGCGIFLSDDNDSKILQEIIRQKSLGSIQVYNRQEALHSCEEGNLNLSRSDKRAFSHS